MATVVNNPSGSTDSGSGIGFLMGVILLIVVGFLIVYYGIPALNRTGGTQQAPAVQIPDTLDINVNTPQGGQQ